jgi:hypothetical protein
MRGGLLIVAVALSSVAACVAVVSPAAHRTLGFASTSASLPGSRCTVDKLCQHAPAVRPGRHSLLGGLRAQADKTKAPDAEQLGQDQTGIQWDVVKAQIALFQKMALPYFAEEKSARVLLGIVICFTLLNSGVSVGFSYLSKDFYNALNSKDVDTFYPVLTRYALALTGGAPVAVLYKFYRDKLGVQWRSWMTQRVLDMYEANRCYYQIELAKDIDNPDQRIAEDMRSFTTVSLAFSITLLTSVIDLVNFSGGPALPLQLARVLAARTHACSSAHDGHTHGCLVLLPFHVCPHRERCSE